MWLLKCVHVPYSYANACTVFAASFDIAYSLLSTLSKVEFYLGWECFAGQTIFSRFFSGFNVCNTQRSPIRTQDFDTAWKSDTVTPGRGVEMRQQSSLLQQVIFPCTERLWAPASAFQYIRIYFGFLSALYFFATMPVFSFVSLWTSTSHYIWF